MRSVNSFLLSILGGAFSCAHSIHSWYMNSKITMKFKNTVIQYPYQISGLQNIECGNSINIGKGAVIMTTRAKIIIKGHFVAGPKLTIITGDHMPMMGKFLDTVTDKDKDLLDKDRHFDQDVIIEEDVWAGVNVTILKGVTIGRGCIIAAGSVVTKSMPPYHVVGGIPAKPIKARLSKEQIIEHEKEIYPEEMRFTLDRISQFLNE